MPAAPAALGSLDARNEISTLLVGNETRTLLLAWRSIPIGRESLPFAFRDR